jgi:hypothetical protein
LSKQKPQGVVRTDQHVAARVLMPPQCRGLTRRRHGQRRIVCRAEWIAPEHVLDVREQQLLVLLLVVQPEGHQRSELRVLGGAHEYRRHCGVHVGPPVEDLGDRRPREQPPSRPRVHLAHGVVIRVEQVVPALVRGSISRHGAMQHEALEEPGHMRQMPLRRADVGHGLHDLIFRSQRRGEPLAESANTGPSIDQGFRRVLSASSGYGKGRDGGHASCLRVPEHCRPPMRVSVRA